MGAREARRARPGTGVTRWSRPGPPGGGRSSDGDRVAPRDDEAFYLSIPLPSDRHSAHSSGAGPNQFHTQQIGLVPARPNRPDKSAFTIQIGKTIVMNVTFFAG